MAIEDGLIDDEDSFRKRMSLHRQRKDELIRLISHGRRRRDIPRNLLSNRNLDRFTRAMRTRLDDPKSSLRRGYVRLLVDQVKVGENQIEIRGSTTALLSAAQSADSIDSGEVPTSIPAWRAKWDSN